MCNSLDPDCAFNQAENIELIKHEIHNNDGHNEIPGLIYAPDLKICRGILFAPVNHNLIYGTWKPLIFQNEKNEL